MPDTINQKYFEMNQKAEVDLEYFYEFFRSRYTESNVGDKRRIMEAMTSIMKKINIELTKLSIDERRRHIPKEVEKVNKIQNHLELYTTMLSWIYQQLEDETEANIVRTFVIFLITYRGTFTSEYPILNKSMDDLHLNLQAKNAIYCKEHIEMRESMDNKYS